MLVQYLHKLLYQLQYNQLVLVFVYNGYEVETRVSFVDDLVLLIVNEVTHFGFSGQHQHIDFLKKSLFLLLRHHRAVPLRQSRSSLPTHQKKTVDHQTIELREKLLFNSPLPN